MKSINELNAMSIEELKTLRTEVASGKIEQDTNAYLEAIKRVIKSKESEGT